MGAPRKGQSLRLPVIMIASLLLARPASMWSFEASDDGNLEIVSRYLDATRTQQAALRGAQMEVDIDAKLPRLAKQGKLRALRKISKVGQITYRALGFSGDTTVKQEVITRYLQAQSDAGQHG